MDAILSGFTIAIMALGAFIYVQPTLLAVRRRHPRWKAIAAINIFLGWTVVGWIIAAVWACLTPHVRPEVTNA